MDAYSILLSVVMSTLHGPHDYTVQVMDRLWSCGSWCLASMPTLGGGGLYAGASGFLPKLKVETNERDGKSQWITVRTWIGTHPTCQESRPVLTGGGKLHFGAALIHPLGVSMYSVRRVPAWPSTYPFPQGRTLANFFLLPFDRFVFALYRFARSHTHLGADCFSRPLPFRTI